MPPPPPSHSRAASTLSCTLSQPKICTRWKVRRRPHRARWTALLLVMSRPPSSTRPSSGLSQARDDVEEGRLAGTVGPDEPEHLAGLELQRHVVQRPHAAEVDAHARQFERKRIQGLWRRWRPSRPTPCAATTSPRRQVTQWPRRFPPGGVVGQPTLVATERSKIGTTGGATGELDRSSRFPSLSRQRPRVWSLVARAE